MSKYLSKAALLAVTLLGGATLSSAASAYTFVTADCTLNSDGWCLGGTNLNGYRNAVTNAVNFGAGGTVSTPVTFSQLASVTDTTLAGANGFISSWWNDGQSAPSVSAVVNFFLGGGDLFLLQDDTNHDAIGAALGIPAAGVSAGSVSNGTSPLITGPFGTATDVTQTGNVGFLSAAAIAAANGSIGSTNASGQITSAYWAAGQYAAGAGKLVILADVDMISDFGTATYAPLNGNGRFGLNSTAYLVESVAAVPEPATWAMMLVGFGLVGGAARYRRRRATVTYA